MKREEAIERIKARFDKWALDNEDMKAIQALIPELAENEDERTRKYIINFVKLERGSNLLPDDADKMLAYLERQKEQIVIKQNIIDSIRANTQPDWDFSTIPNLNEEVNRFFGEKFILPHTEDTIITVSDVIRCVYHFYKFGQQEQKPAEWSEEDEDKIDSIIGIICSERECAKIANIGEEKEDNSAFYNDLVLFLKSLRPQPHWKQSLATADLENNLCDIQDNYHDCSHEYKVLGEAIEFIRSTESHWKPSEEQMAMLRAVLNEPKNAMAESAKIALESLYNDLKKLM